MTQTTRDGQAKATTDNQITPYPLLELKTKIMLITDLKIEVTSRMMQENGMTRGAQLGVPVDPAEPSKGLSWKTFEQLQDEDFDKIEDYFLLKAEKQ